MKFYESGRSMVEMLGVLAIIGVLSVGAIAGYSKAMRKYRINKLTEQLNTVINASARYAKSFSNLTADTTITSYLVKMKEIPEDMIKDSDTYIYDTFGNPLRIDYHPANSLGVPNVNVIYYQVPLTDTKGSNLDICQTVFTIIKEHLNDLYYMYLVSGDQSDDTRQNVFYGNTYCYSGVTCLKNMNLTDIAEACLTHAGNSGVSTIVMLWKN